MKSDHPNTLLIKRFYEACDKHDAETMVNSYHREVRFSDNVFGPLSYDEVCGMWRMLLSRSKDLRVVASNILADDTRGQAHWEATYTFSKTGRQVINRIDAEFTFKDGRIIIHNDTFSFWKWAQQALGPIGLLLGWTPLIQNKVSSEAKKSLAHFLKPNRK